MLSIESLTVGYSNAVVINDCTLHLAPGLVHGLVGRNGAGKTTLLNAIFGLHPATAGTIQWNDEPTSPRNTIMLPAANYFYPKMTGEEYLQIFAVQNPGLDIENWNAVFDLPLGDYVETYSTGMKQRLALMSALGSDSPVLLLDEPANSIDLEGNFIMNKILSAQAKAGRLIVITSHILGSLRDVCDKIHVLEDGKVLRSFERGEFGELEGSIFHDVDEALIAALSRGTV